MTGNLPDRLLTAPEVAAMLGFAEGTVRNMASAGDLPTVKLGRALRFRHSEIEAWIDRRDAESREHKKAG